MSKLSTKKRKKSRRTARRQPQAATLETRTAEAVTVAWLLSTMATLLAEIGAVIGFALLLWFAEPEAEEVNMLNVLPGLLLLIGVVTGLVALVLTPVANRIRRVPPPRSVTRFAVVVGLSPLATWLALKFVDLG